MTLMGLCGLYYSKLNVKYQYIFKISKPLLKTNTASPLSLSKLIMA